MIVGQREVIHRTNNDLSVLRHRAVFGGMHAQNRALRRINDRRREHGTENAAVGNRKRTAGKLFDSELAVLGPLAEIGDLFLDIRKGKLIAVAQDRHHQPARTAHRNADIEIAVIDDVCAIHRGVHHGEFLQGVYAGLHEKGHEAELDAMLLFELVLVAIAQVHDRLHVDLVERGQDCSRGLRFHQSLGDALAQARHGHALLRSVTQHAVDIHRGWQRRRRFRCGGRRLQLAGHVLLGDATTAAGAADLRCVETVVGGHFLCRGHDRRRLSFRCGRVRRLRETCGSGRRRCVGRSLCIGIDGRNHLVAGDRTAVALDDFAQHARRRRRQLQHDFIGLDIDQIFVAPDEFTLLLVPRQQCGLGDRFRQCRDLDFD